MLYSFTVAGGHVGQIKFRAEKIHEWLKVNEWTQAQLAEALGVTKEFLWMILNDKRFPSVFNLEKLCQITGLDPGILLAYDRESPDREPAASAKES